MSFNKSGNSSSELSEQVVTPLRGLRQISPPSNDNIQALSDSPLLDDDQQVKGNKKNPSDFEKQIARRRELELWRLSKKSKTGPPIITTTNNHGTPNSNSGPTRIAQQPTSAWNSGQITSPFSSNQRLRRLQNPHTTTNNSKPTTLGTQKLLFSELSPRRIPESRKRKSVAEQQPSINPPPKKPLTNNASSRTNKPEIRNTNVQPTNRPMSTNTAKFIPIIKNHQPANDTHQLNLSSILIVEDKTLYEEDKFMLDNIVKITDSLDKEPFQLSHRENEMPILPPKIEEIRTDTSFANDPSILLDVSYTGSEPRSARKSMKQKSFVSNPANSVAFSPLVNKTKSLAASLLTPLNTMDSLMKGTTENGLSRSLIDFSLLDDSKPSIKGGSQLLTNLTNPTNLSTLTKTINLNTSITNDLDQLKSKILELEENLKKERQEKEMWMERYKNLATNTSLLSKTSTVPFDSKIHNNGSFLTEIKR